MYYLCFPVDKLFTTTTTINNNMQQQHHDTTNNDTKKRLVTNLQEKKKSNFSEDCIETDAIIMYKIRTQNSLVHGVKGVYGKSHSGSSPERPSCNVLRCTRTPQKLR